MLSFSPFGSSVGQLLQSLINPSWNRMSPNSTMAPMGGAPANSNVLSVLMSLINNHGTGSAPGLPTLPQSQNDIGITGAASSDSPPTSNISLNDLHKMLTGFSAGMYGGR